MVDRVRWCSENDHQIENHSYWSNISRSFCLLKVPVHQRKQTRWSSTRKSIYLRIVVAMTMIPTWLFTLVKIKQRMPGKNWASVAMVDLFQRFSESDYYKHELHGLIWQVWKPLLTHVADEPLVMNLSATSETSSDTKNSIAVGIAVKIPAFESSTSKLSFSSSKAYLAKI